MDLIRRFGRRSTTRYLIFGLVIWWLAMFIGYSIISFRTDRIKRKIGKSGIEIAHEFSKLVSLPLLEKEAQEIHSLLTDAAKKKDVVYASVVDHRNKIVAFTGTGHLLPEMTEAARSVEQVSIWEGGLASHAKVLNFAADVTYAGTKIGEFFVGLSTAGTAGAKNQFGIIAVSSCAVLLLILMVLSYPAIKTFAVKFINREPSNSVTDSFSKEALFQCPMCGTQKPVTGDLFKQSKLAEFLTTGISGHGPKVENPAGSKRIDLQALAESEDLSWIKRRIILRCTEIINKLAA
jgi:sensor histidine kinase regulating citrate/malate metabolism